MSIRKPWRSARRRDRQARAFTLIELLVVVAILAILMSILLPSLGAAREQARAVVCAQHLRQFGNALQGYAAENQDWLPGTNTSGVALKAKRMSWGADIGQLFQSRLPVQPFDWMTPLLAYATELPAVRADRFKFLLEKFRCPSQFYPSIVYEFSSGPDINDFFERDPWPAISYLMSVHFQYVGQKNKRVLGYMEHPSLTLPIYAEAADPQWEVLVRDFNPRINLVGPAASKVFVADGTRYLDESLTLDHDVSVLPQQFGSFTSAGAWWAGDRSYGVRIGSRNWDNRPVNAGSKGNGQNLAISYRHGRQQGVLSGDARDNRGEINAVFFDGHVDRLSDRESREAHLWYPSGAVVKKPMEGMTNLPMDFVIP